MEDDDTRPQSFQEKVTGAFLDMKKKMVEAHGEGVNELLVGGKKVAGKKRKKDDNKDERKSKKPSSVIDLTGE